MDFDLENIRAIFGLGNIGNKYSGTRHNAGFMFVEELSGILDPTVNWQSQSKLYGSIAKQPSLRLVKPSTLMNRSGDSVAAVSNYFNLTPSQILIVHDDLDIPLGKTKLQFSKGPIKHNGVDSVENSLGTDEFWRLRLGIDNRQVRGNKGIPGMKYALQKFIPEEKNIVLKVIKEVIETSFTKKLSISTEEE